LIIKNPCKNVILAKQAKKEIVILTVYEQKRLLKALEGHRLYAAIYTLMATGVRIGELLALK
jgi:integrase